MIQIIKIGTPIKTKVGNLRGQLIGVCLRMGSIEYQMRYISNGEPHECWFYDIEIEIDRPTQTAGFGRKQQQEEIDNTFLISLK
jgi:hypothetical protein